MSWKNKEELFKKAPDVIAVVKAMQGHTFADLENAHVEFADGPRILGMLSSYAIWWANEEKRPDIAKRISDETKALGFTPFIETVAA